jgi:hypothetical protein
MGGKIMLKLRVILEKEVVKVYIELPYCCPVLRFCDRCNAWFGYRLFKVWSTEWGNMAFPL